MKLLFYTKNLVPRIEYIVNTLFDGIAGYQLELTENQEHFLLSRGAKIEYANKPIDPQSFAIPIHPFILEKGIYRQKIDVRNFDLLPAFFYCQETAKADIPFDLLSMAFYLISRYEEYLPFSEDQHGRFSAHQSVAFKHKFLRQPLIDQWVNVIKKELSKRFASSPVKSKAYNYVSTIDVDFGWSYLHKNLWRSTGGLMKDLLKGHFRRVLDRVSVFRGHVSDPYDQYDFLNHLHRVNNCEAIFFFLFAEYGTFDKNTSADHPAMQELVQTQSKISTIGIHPSYASNLDDAQLQKEKEKLARVSNQPITKSRQHFLKLKFPDTYRRLLSIGIKEDYTMGYAEDVGFRASTSHAFNWYDLKNERSTLLKVHPFQVMDVTLKNYLNLSPDEALHLCLEMKDSIKAVDGTFVSIWHNSSFSSLMGWNGWKKVYKQLVENAV